MADIRDTPEWISTTLVNATHITDQGPRHVVLDAAAQIIGALRRGLCSL